MKTLTRWACDCPPYHHDDPTCARCGPRMLSESIMADSPSVWREAIADTDVDATEREGSEET